MLIILAIVLVAAFIGAGFIRKAWLKIPVMLAALWIAGYAGVQFGIQFQKTRVISDLMAPLNQFAWHLMDIKSDEIRKSEITEWAETIKNSNYQIEPVRDKMFELIMRENEKK
jgi:hypothetical protein